MIAPLLLLTLWLLVQSAWVTLNLRQWPRLATSAGPPGLTPPLVSLLIPARNEAHRIRETLDSVLAQDYSPLELIALDDQSTDETLDVLNHYAERPRPVRVLTGRPLPSGAFGKAHACQQLANAASGHWLLFVDADVVLTPDAASRLIATAVARKADVLTGFPRVDNTCLTAWLATSMMVFTIAAHLPVRLVERSPNPRFVAGSGMVMLLSRKAYDQIGGHATAAQHIVDDMTMLRAAKAASLRVSLVDISACASVQMYQTATQVWDGFRKNLYAGLGRSPWLLGLVMLLYTCWYLVPPVLVLVSLIALFLTHERAYAFAGLLAAAATGIGVFMKWIVDRRFRVPARYSLLAPLSAALLLAIAVTSAWDDWQHRGYNWKGRRYP
ncbi:MAG: glycosyltransferase [Firmicutes bacterium]|nr:glycosyltransferase [Bacillota bacterium]